MKNLLLFSFLLLTACSKSLDRPAATGATYVKYNIGGVQVQFNGSNDHLIPNTEGAICSKFTGDLFHLYHIVAQKGIGNNGISFMIDTENLTEKTYPMMYFEESNVPFKVNSTLITKDGKVYSSMTMDNVPIFFLTITRNSNNSIDGTFYGKLLGADDKTVQVTGGEFKNIHIVY